MGQVGKPLLHPRAEVVQVAQQLAHHLPQGVGQVGKPLLHPVDKLRGLEDVEDAGGDPGGNLLDPLPGPLKVQGEDAPDQVDDPVQHRFQAVPDALDGVQKAVEGAAQGGAEDLRPVLGEDALQVAVYLPQLLLDLVAEDGHPGHQGGDDAHRPQQHRADLADRTAHHPGHLGKGAADGGDGFGNSGDGICNIGNCPRYRADGSHNAQQRHNGPLHRPRKIQEGVEQVGDRRDDLGEDGLDFFRQFRQGLLKFQVGLLVGGQFFVVLLPRLVGIVKARVRQGLEDQVLLFRVGGGLGQLGVKVLRPDAQPIQ